MTTAVNDAFSRWFEFNRWWRGGKSRLISLLIILWPRPWAESTGDLIPSSLLSSVETYSALSVVLYRYYSVSFSCMFWSLLWFRERHKTWRSTSLILMLNQARRVIFCGLNSIVRIRPPDTSFLHFPLHRVFSHSVHWMWIQLGCQLVVNFIIIM